MWCKAMVTEEIQTLIPKDSKTSILGGGYTTSLPLSDKCNLQGS